MANSDTAEVPGMLANQAKGIIDSDDLSELRCNHMAELGKVRKWRALALKLDLVHPWVVDRDILLKMQQFIAMTPHDMSCPCSRRIVLATIEEQYLEWDAIPALELKEKQLAEVDAEKSQLQLRRQRIEGKWRDDQARLSPLRDTWTSTILTHFHLSFLEQLRSSIQEVETWLLDFIYRFSFILPISRH